MAPPKVTVCSSSRGPSIISNNFVAILFVSVILVGFLTHVTYSCNEQVCASIVSKCMLTQSCKCDLKNCTCCKECYNCLNYLYGECCSCVDMCPKPNETQQARQLTSLPDKLEGFPALFDALTVDQDDQERWVSFTFPVDFPEALFDKELSFSVIDSPDQNIDDIVKLHNNNNNGGQGGKNNVVTVNCTVAYVSQCLSLGKCRTQCVDMGASSMRWFQDGCCECVGHTCINYGITESRCLHCSENLLDEDLEPSPSEDELDYGEGMEPLDGTMDHVNKL